LFADKKIKLRISGGTDVKWAMPYDFLKDVFIPQLKRHADIELNLIKRGYYPRGGGEIEIKIDQKYKLSDFDKFEEFWEFLKKDAKKIELIEKGSLQQIKGVSHSSKSLENDFISERQAQAAKLILSKYKCPISIRTEYCDTYSPGSGITLYAIFSEELNVNPIILGADALGEKTKTADIVGKEAADKLTEQIDSGAPVDEHMADNLIPFLGLFGGRIKVSEITKHTRTNIYTTEQFLGRIFRIDEKSKIISVD